MVRYLCMLSCNNFNFNCSWNCPLKNPSKCLWNSTWSWTDTEKLLKLEQLTNTVKSKGGDTENKWIGETGLTKLWENDKSILVSVKKQSLFSQMEYKKTHLIWFILPFLSKLTLEQRYWLITPGSDRWFSTGGADLCEHQVIKMDQERKKLPWLYWIAILNVCTRDRMWCKIRENINHSAAQPLRPLM